MNAIPNDPTGGEHSEFDALLEALGTGAISESQRARLSEIVESDPVARERYLSYMATEASLQWHFGAVEAKDEEIPSSKLAPVVAPQAGSSKRRWMAALATAACLCLGLLLYNSITPPEDDDDQTVVEIPTPPIVVPAEKSLYTTFTGVPGWHLAAREEAKFQLLADQSIRLEAGELYAASHEPKLPNQPNLIIRTADGDVTATGTRIYITASHQEAASEEPQAEARAGAETKSTNLKPSAEVMKTSNPLATLTRVFIIAGIATIANEAGLAQGAAGEQLEARKGVEPKKLQEDGNYKEAYEIYHKLLTDPGHGGAQGAIDVAAARDCLTRLKRIAEWDTFAKEVIAAHEKDWRVLHAVASQIRRLPHYGIMIDGEFERERNGRGRLNTSERDRLESLQLLDRARAHTADEKDGEALADFYHTYASAMKSSGNWRLQILSDLGALPDYGVPVFHTNIQGAPVTKNDEPLYYAAPKSWEEAKSDGERWRWLLAKMAEADPKRAPEAKLEYALFLRSQFGVQSMGFAPRLSEDGKPEEGVYSVHTLKDSETIARLASGIRRWELPAEHNFVSLFREIGSDRPVRKASPIKDLSYKLYHGNWDKLPDFTKLDPVAQGTLPSGFFRLGVMKRRDQFGLSFEGTLVVEKPGEYTFAVSSDDGSILTVGNDFTVDNDGLHGFETSNTGKVQLAKGEHAIRLRYFEQNQSEGLEVSWSGPQTGGEKQMLSLGDRTRVPAEQALDALASVYENRLQYPQAAAIWKETIEHFGPGPNGHRRERLAQIVDNWGRFENTEAFTKGSERALGYVFRNGKKLNLRATSIKVETLLADIKAYLKTNPARLDHNKANPSTIGRRLVYDNETRYRGEIAAEWTLDLEPRENHWDRRIDVTLKMKEPGAYLLEATLEDGNTSRIIVWINDTAIVGKALHQSRLYLVNDSTTGKPVPNANVEFFGYWSRWISKKNGGRDGLETSTRNFAEKSDAQGLVFPDPKDLDRHYRWLITVREPDSGRLAILGFNGVWTSDYHSANYQANKAYTITDRPLYRPGAKVNFKSWIRAARYDMAWVSHFKDKKFTVEIHNPKGEKIYTKDLTAGEFGGIHDSIELPDDATLGRYRLLVYAKPFVDPFSNKRHNSVHLGATSFQVEEFKKPEYEVTVEPPSEPTVLGDPIKAKISAKYYFGAPVRNAVVHYRIERKAHNERWTPARPWDWFYGKGYWWYHEKYEWYPGWREWGCWIHPPSGWNPAEVVADNEVEIGPDGTVEIEIATEVAKELFGNTDHRYTITAEVMDESRRTIVGTGSVIAARNPFEIYSWLNGGHFRVGDTMEASFQARTANGTAVTGTGEVTLHKISYDEKGTPTEKVVKSWKLDPDENGSAKQRIAATESGHYRVAYKLTDAKGSTREGATLVVIRGDNNDGRDFRFNNLELVLDKAEYKPGDRVKVLINTAQKDSTVAFFVRPVNGIYKKPEILSLPDGTLEREVEIAIADMPNLYLEAITVVDGVLYTKSQQIVVPPEKRVLTVEVTPSSEKFKPGQAGKVNVRLIDSAGKPFVGETVLTIYDKSLEYISGGMAAGDIRAYFWQWRRHHSPRQESSLGASYAQLFKNGERRMNSIGVFGRSLADVDFDKFSTASGVEPSTKSVNFGLVAASAFGEGRENKPAEKDRSRGGNRGLRAEAQRGESPVPPPTVRKKFADSAVWVASVMTDSQGNAIIPIEMPENLTTWRIMAWGLGNGTVVGSGEAEVITSKDLLIRMQAPRFFTEKDEVVLSANVHNYLKDKQEVKVTLETEGGHLALLEDASQHQILNIAPGGDQRIDWRVKVSGEGEATVRMLAAAKGDSDAMEMKFPVYIHGALKTDSWSGVVAADKQSSELEFTVPKERRAEQSHLEVRYSPSIAMAMVDALPYLATYPYKNSESTVSRFLPAVITQKILKDMGVNLAEVKEKRTNLNPQEIGDPDKRAAQWKKHRKNNPVWDEAELARMVKVGLRDLAATQNSDGGFSWFRSGHSGPHTTAQAVHGLLLAKENGVAVVPNMFDRGVNWLINHQKQEVQKLKNAPRKVHPWKSQADNMDAYLAFVLAEAGKSNEEMNKFLYRDRTHLAVYAKALVGIAFHLLEKHEERDMLVRNIRQFQVQDPENQSTYLKLGNENYWYYWYGNEVEAHSAYLRLLSYVAPVDPATAGLAKYLLNNRKHGSYWHSTRDTSFAIESLAAYAKASGEVKADMKMTIEVLVDGKIVKEVQVNGANLFTFDNVVSLSGEDVTAGKHKVEFRKKGEGPLYFNTYLTVFSLEDFITKAGLEIKVERRYYLVDRGITNIKAAGVGNRVVDFKTGHDKRKKLSSGDTLAIGDLVEVELILESKNDYEYIMFEDRKAAGFEPVQLRSGNSRTGTLGAYMELRDERVAFFVRHMPRGKHSLTYRLRAEIPGQFSALPANGNGVYAPELRANSDEMKIKVVDAE